MPSLSCDAIHCAHNKNNCCCLSNIKVKGAKAKTSDKTCCESFIEQQGTMNLNESTCANLSIDCEAQHCTYNEDCVCHADRVDIVGNNACCCTGTECGTFVKE